MAQGKIYYKGKYSKDDGGTIKLAGLSNIQFDTVMTLVRSWNVTEKTE